MSLPRKSVHVKLDHDVHADLLDLCEYDHILPAHWIERLVENELAKEFHASRISQAPPSRKTNSG